MFLMSNEVLNLAVKMSISSAKRMGDVATVYDTKSKKVILCMFCSIYDIYSGVKFLYNFCKIV